MVTSDGSARSCPTSEKRFRTPIQEVAEAAARQLTSGGNRMSAYRCSCGLWHLRNETKRARGRRSRRARLRQRRRCIETLTPTFRLIEPEEWIW